MESIFKLDIDPIDALMVIAYTDLEDLSYVSFEDYSSSSDDFMMFSSKASS